MNLEEMLDYTAKQYLDDRVDIVDGDSDSLWSDAFLVRQFNQAQRILARRAWCIIETGQSPAGIVTLSTGKVLYPLHKSILFVYDATPSTQTAPLGRGDDVALRSPYPAGSDAYEVGAAASAAGTTSEYPGPPLAIATDAATRTLFVSPEPTADQNGLQIAMKIARLPIAWLDLAKPKACPEVPEDWHMDLCEYAAGMALTMPNVDSANKVDGRELLNKFAETVREARRDRQRASYNGSRWGFASTTAVLR